MVTSSGPTMTSTTSTLTTQAFSELTTELTTQLLGNLEKLTGPQLNALLSRLVCAAYGSCSSSATSGLSLVLFFPTRWQPKCHFLSQWPIRTDRNMDPTISSVHLALWLLHIQVMHTCVFGFPWNAPIFMLNMVIGLTVWICCTLAVIIERKKLKKAPKTQIAIWLYSWIGDAKAHV